MFDGERWQEVDTLYNEKNYDVYRTNILCDNENNIHLLISIAYGAFGRIYYMKREGNNWSELKQISVDSLGNTSDHDMVIDNTGKIYIFFHSNNIYYRTLKDTVLSDPINLTNLDLNQYTATEPTVAINSHNNIYLSYALTDNISRVSEIYFKQFNDSQWSDAEILSQINDLSAYNPYITVDQSNNPHVVWRQGQQEELYYILYTTRFIGQWTVPINISNIPNSSSYRPKINLYKGKPIVFFHNINENGEEENYYSYLSDDVWSVSKFDVDINTSPQQMIRMNFGMIFF